jgi:peptidoglycan/xylan/chitin deacetylase (PgdA/CDA1 family)
MNFYGEPGVRWPAGARMAVMVSFDFDAETLWLSRDAANAEKLVTMSYGTFGARVGVPAILRLLRHEGLPATFFVPGWTAERHTAVCAAILEAGHEIAHHGYLHLWPDPDKPEEAEAELMQGLEALERTLGVRPVGYRAPAGELTRHLMGLLVRERFGYLSSFKADIVPYRHGPESGGAGLIELPTDSAIDDTAYGFTHLRTPKPLFAEEHVLAIWQQSFAAMHAAGGLFNMVLHPQVSGRPMRLELLRKFLAYARGFEGVWFATGRDIAHAFAAQEGAHSGVT